MIQVFIDEVRNGTTFADVDPAYVNPDEYYYLKSAVTPHVLFAMWGSNSAWDNGDDIGIYTSKTWSSQKWKFARAATDGHYRIVHKADGRVLHAFWGNNYSWDDYDNVVLYENNTSWKCQEWELVDAGGGKYKIKNRDNGKLLTVGWGSNSQYDDSDSVLVVDDYGWNSQLWSFNN
ncbi:RICIN domain-containing protein [Pontiella sulfatireligans]|uniref:Ricin B lectin domain-containing protein n=1 Tax=Pontiella sulfatireligans TaxID=2750658 RepID=A0A6C2UPR8_9BACT|nr:RICIN domain-containing protein [Pontiella sulfatireligans]VGO21923.1 hypothetical protein SCARR_04003 [Pontiella sulfatireligans]